jgi:hypothetical protein
MNIDKVIREGFAQAQLDDAARELLWVEVLAAREAADVEPVPAANRHGRLPRRAFVLAVAVALLVSGVAAAATTGIVQNLFADDAPVVERVDQLRDETVERATPEEYAQLRENNMVPNSKRIGILRDDEMKPLVELAGIEASRVIVDDPDVGRVVAVPTRDGTQWCYIFQGPGFGGDGSCGGSFGKAGVSISWTKGSSGLGEPVTWGVHGVTSDDVTRIEVELEDGAHEPVKLVQNAYLWSSTEQPPVAVHVWRGARHDEERLPPSADLR